MAGGVNQYKEIMDEESIRFSDMCNAEIVARMRKCNYEQFKTLVRMHLSFELDLNTDEFDLPCHEILYEDKGKLKKWSRQSKKYKLTSSTCTSSIKNCSNGSAVDNDSIRNSLQQQIDAGFLFHLQELKEFLMLEKNLLQEGIFRKNGSTSRQNELRLQIQNDKPLNLCLGGYTAHDCSTVFKSYLAELPEPLLTDAHYPAHLQIAPLCLSANPSLNDTQASTSKTSNEKQKRDLHVLTCIQLLLLLLPDENRQLLQHIIEMLHAVALQQTINKMSADNLATLFTPHLICPRNLPPEALHYVSKKMSSIISYMIIRGNEIFAVPAKLATDTRAFFMERKRKKTMSPDMALDESISDISTVNTVYTFVDRERTAAAHNTNNTDTELAQLYAFIQSLPESSKKRRLIKQFNKQNGQGTPQLQAMNRVKNSELNKGTKSIGDSIKKHIFQKGIMSRTPKRPVPPTAITLETPHTAGNKTHKQRVLFQSPNPTVDTYATTHSTPSLTSPSYTNFSATKSTNTINTFNIKSHPLQKSISSTSLLLSSNNPSRVNSELKEELGTCHRNSLNNSNGSESKSAPVSRQSSSDASQELIIADKTTTTDAKDVTNFITHLKLLSHATKHLMTSVDFSKKSVLNSHQHIGNAKHPLQAYTGGHELKTRYKSEPNLSICDAPPNTGSSIPEIAAPISKLMQTKCITRKLMKGVSMSNLKFGFNTPVSTKRIARTVSSSLKHRFIDDTQIENHTATTFYADFKTCNEPLLKDVDDNDLDDDTFEDDPADDCGDSADSLIDSLNTDSTYINPSTDNGTCFTLNVGMTSNPQLPLLQSCLYRNRDLLSSTPSTLPTSRRSMSPITISTQRMPKAMQESIMTPRSRKPVMVLTTTISSTEQNHTIVAADLSEFPTDSKAQDVEGNESVSKESFNSLSQDSRTALDEIENNFPETLSAHFKDYLLRRSVLADSQDDVSTSSHSDDYDSSAKFENLDNKQLTNSLLYCLDGNSPTKAIPDSNTSIEQNFDITKVNKELLTKDAASHVDFEGIDDQVGNSLLYYSDSGNRSTELILQSNTKATETDTIEQNLDMTKMNTELPAKDAATNVEDMDDANRLSVETKTTTTTLTKTNRLANNPFVIFNKVRKRAASSDLDKIASKLFNSQTDYINHVDEHNEKADGLLYMVDKLSEEKENRQQNSNRQDLILADKLLINEYPNETLF